MNIALPVNGNLRYRGYRLSGRDPKEPPICYRDYNCGHFRLEVQLSSTKEMPPYPESISISSKEGKKFKEFTGYGTTYKYAIWRSPERRLVYPLAVQRLSWSRRKYFLFRTVLIVFLVAQIGVAAALTAIGSSGSRIDQEAVTILGAINLAIGSLLALLKGFNVTGSAYQSMHDMADTIEFMDRTMTLIELGERVLVDDANQTIQLNAAVQARCAWEMYHKGVIGETSAYVDQPPSGPQLGTVSQGKQLGSSTAGDGPVTQDPPDPPVTSDTGHESNAHRADNLPGPSTYHRDAAPGASQRDTASPTPVTPYAAGLTTPNVSRIPLTPTDEKAQRSAGRGLVDSMRQYQPRGTNVPFSW